jgi:hypothetical protein
MATAATNNIAQLPPQTQDRGMVGSWYDSYMAERPETQSYDAAQATTTQWTPGANATVQGQIADITTSGNPLMVRAETRAKQQANDRGMLNSSMAIGAGQAAVYDAALPIAQQDAGTFARAGEFNANAANATSLNNAQFTNQSRQFNTGAANDALTQQRTAGVQGQMQRSELDSAERRQTQQIEAQTGMQRYDLEMKKLMSEADNATRIELQRMDSTTRASLAEIESKFKVQMQTSESMSRSYQQLTDGITRIMLDPEMDGNARQEAINNLTALYNNTLQMQSRLTGLNLGDLLVAPTPTIGPQLPWRGPGEAGPTPGAPGGDTSLGGVDPTDPSQNGSPGG